MKKKFYFLIAASGEDTSVPELCVRFISKSTGVLHKKV